MQGLIELCCAGQGSVEGADSDRGCTAHMRTHTHTFNIPPHTHMFNVHLTASHFSINTVLTSRHPPAALRAISQHPQTFFPLQHKTCLPTLPFADSYWSSDRNTSILHPLSLLQVHLPGRAHLEPAETHTSLPSSQSHYRPIQICATIEIHIWAKQHEPPWTCSAQPDVHRGLEQLTKSVHARIGAEEQPQPENTATAQPPIHTEYAGGTLRHTEKPRHPTQA